MAAELLRNFKFRVNIAGLSELGFQKASGLSSSVEVIEYREGGDAITSRKFPGQVSYNNVTLERGITENNQELRNWFESVLDVETARSNGADVKRNVAIEVLDNAGVTQRKFTLKNAFVCNREITDLDATGNEILIETLELCHEGLKEITITA
jgi:phage tail-like protein